MENKFCKNCSTEKPEEEFSFKNKAKGIRQAHCKECHKIWRRSHYEDNKEKEYKRARAYKKERQQWLREFKKDKECSKCGFKHPAALQFHHREGEEKSFNIAHAAQNGIGEDRVLEEIAKCDILCANCHFIEHYG